MKEVLEIQIIERCLLKFFVSRQIKTRAKACPQYLQPLRVHSERQTA